LRFYSASSDAGSATQLKPGWSSWTGVQAAHAQAPGIRASDVRIPFAYLALISGASGAILTLRQYRQVRPGHCPVCAYDLTSNMSGTCPECGTVIVSKRTEDK